MIMNSTWFPKPMASRPKHNIFADKKLGSGRFQVYHAKIPFQDKEYALKAFPKDASSQVSYRREQDIISSLSHKNIIKYASGIHLTGLEDMKYDFIVMEYAPYGTFFDLIINKGLTEEKLIRTYFHQLVEGLEHMHSQRIAHVDLKLENLLLGKEFMLKITDFDQSQRTDEKKQEYKGTACYRAPETLEGTRQDFLAADIYSVGVILYTFKAKEFPFIEKQEGAGVKLIHYDLFSERNEDFWAVKSSEKRNGEELFSADFKELINGMLEKDPRARFGIQDIKSSKWYNGPIFRENELKEKMEKLWEKITFKKALKRGNSFNKHNSY